MIAGLIPIPPDWLRYPPKDEDEIAERMMAILSRAVQRKRAAEAEAAESRTKKQAA